MCGDYPFSLFLLCSQDITTLLISRLSEHPLHVGIHRDPLLGSLLFSFLIIHVLFLLFLFFWMAFLFPWTPVTTKY